MENRWSWSLSHNKPEGQAMRRSTILISALALALAPTLAAGKGKGGFKRREFQRQYREILQQYSGGDMAGAVTALIEAETDAVATSGPKVLEPLRKAKLKVTRELLTTEAEVLIPVIALHEEAYLTYREREQAELIPGAREMVVDLVETYVDSADSAAGRVTASQMMTSMAGHLQEMHVDSSAAALYRRALDLDEHNITALIGLSFLHEQYGEYPDAVRLLETLVEIDPWSGAAQLRLGVNLVRMGREESGAIYLRDVLNDRNPTWMRSVAYQELARVLTDSNKLQEARTLLEEGVRTLPDDPNLLIQLAYLSERNGSFSEDPALRLALRYTEGQPPQASPRFVYSQLPEMALTEMRQILERQMEDNLQSLGLALTPATAGQPGS